MIERAHRSLIYRLGGWAPGREGPQTLIIVATPR
jgi:hypothetical protein